ncbi:50S ribosomal protein L21 [Candidatus Deianiraea vastatrix]|uniref:Large ribosomal subunit protein bL21 n=1 Tax=Candidatus Deianiraea vastatrix TaxID=2163644 RepID=A0A5B8XGB6_9RICK|nr:50S ribosomal protein L21 [Candidatus Deianiraea vastatrix]QED23354.1 50S ribosomal protein L21 [Candidatus Deianiraea vastatrix]
MFAILQLCGKQYRGDLGCTLVLDRLDGEVGSIVEVKKEDILLIGDDKAYKIGSDKKKVSLQILEHFKGEKVTIFKKRRRKNYERKNGFKASHTKVLIKEIA